MARREEALADRMDWRIAQPQWTRELEQAARRDSERQTWDDANPEAE